MLSMRRCCPDKTLFTFVRVELISFLPFTDCSNCRVVGKMCRTLPIKPRTSVKSLGYKTPWQLFEKKKKKVWKSKKEKKQQRVFLTFYSLHAATRVAARADNLHLYVCDRDIC